MARSIAAVVRRLEKRLAAKKLKAAKRAAREALKKKAETLRKQLSQL